MSLILNITSSERASLMKLLQAVQPQPWFLHYLLPVNYDIYHYPITLPTCFLISLSRQYPFHESRNFNHPYTHREKESRREEGRKIRKAVCLEVGEIESAVTMEIVIIVKNLCWMVHVTQPGEWMLEMMEPKEATAVEWVETGQFSSKLFSLQSDCLVPPSPTTPS